MSNIKKKVLTVISACAFALVGANCLAGSPAPKKPATSTQTSVPQTSATQAAVPSASTAETVMQASGYVFDISPNRIAIDEYDASGNEKKSYFDIDPQVKLENANSLSEIAYGDKVDIKYVRQAAQKVAKDISLEVASNKQPGQGMQGGSEQQSSSDPVRYDDETSSSQGDMNSDMNNDTTYSYGSPSSGTPMDTQAAPKGSQQNMRMNVVQISGYVADISPTELVLEEYDSYGKETQDSFDIDPQVKIENAASLDEITYGDKVTVQYANQGGKKIAKVINLQSSME